MTDNVEEEKKNDDDETFKLILKLDNQIQEVKKSILCLPDYNLDLDFGLDFDTNEEEKKQNNEIKTEKIIINNNIENKEEEEKLKNKKHQDNFELNEQNNDIINENNNNLENNENLHIEPVGNNNKEKKDEENFKKNINDNIEENIKIENKNTEDRNDENKNDDKNEDKNDENKNDDNKEDKNNENKNDISSNFDLLLTDEEKEEEEKNNKINNNNNINNGNNININCENNNISENYISNNENNINNEKNNKDNDNNNINNENNHINEKNSNEKNNDINGETNVNQNENINNIFISHNSNFNEDSNEEGNKNIILNNNNKLPNIQTTEKQKRKEKDTNNKKSESIYEDCDEISDNEFSRKTNKQNEENEQNKKNDNNINKTNSVEIEDEKISQPQENNIIKDRKETLSSLDISEKNDINSNNNKNIEPKPTATNIENQKNQNNENKERNKELKSNTDLSDENIKNITVDKISNFRNQKLDIDRDELEQYPTINLDFNYKEKTLDDLIPSLKNIIEDNETSKEAEKRKNDFMEHVYFERNVITNPLLEFVRELKTSHIDLMEQIYNEEDLKNIPKISTEEEKTDLLNKIFENNLNINNNKIGEIEDKENFLYKYHCENNKEITEKSLKYISYWRKIEGDGNSFFRVTMFGILENYIITNSIENLNLIISEITCDRFIQIYKDNNINYEITFNIFRIILYLLTNNKIEEAYSIFIQSYSLKDNSFDTILILYLRNISFDYTEKALELSKDEEIQNQFEERIIPLHINQELIKTMNIEPDFFVLCLMSYLFDINFRIFYLDRDLLKPKESLIKFFDVDNPDNIPCISISYCFSSYHKIYEGKFIKEDSLMQKILNKNKYEMKKLTQEIKINKKCQNCKGEVYIILFEKKIKVCKNCLDDYINEILNTRKEALINDNYIGKEYYTRPIKLKEDYFLNDFEFIEIKEEYNMINYLQQKLSVMCSRCKEFFTKRNLNNLKCKCILCDKCLNDMIIQTTNGKKILNIYEKNNFGKMSCSECGGSFSYENVLDHLKDIKESDKEKAIGRMEEYAKTLCLICGEKVREKKSEENNNIINEDEEEDEEIEKYTELKKFKKILLKRESEGNKGIDYIDTEHVICLDCDEKNKRNKILENTSSDDDESYIEKKYSINYTEGTCFCRICNKKHYLLEKTVKNGGCCTTSFCSVF